MVNDRLYLGTHCTVAQYVFKLKKEHRFFPLDFLYFIHLWSQNADTADPLLWGGGLNQNADMQKLRREGAGELNET